MADDPQSIGARPRRRRRRGATRRRLALTITRIGTVLLGSILGLILVLAFFADSRSGHREPGPHDGRRVAHEASDRPASRPVLRYSVVAGGVYNAGEVTAAKSRDPLVARHYEDVVPAALRPVTVDRDRFVYVSYRKNGTIYWTKRRVLLRSGEAILTDGAREIRSRCGNRVSLSPMSPVAEADPTPLDLDALVENWQSDPEPEAALPLLDRRSRAALPLALPFQSLPQGPIGAPGNTGESSVLGFIDNPWNGVFIGPPLFPNPPGLVDTQTTVDDAGRSTTTPDDPGLDAPPVAGDADFDPRALDAPPDDPRTDGPTMTITPGDPFPPAPEQTVPVPEPTTLLLLGGGLAGLVIRRMRR